MSQPNEKKRPAQPKRTTGKGGGAAKKKEPRSTQEKIFRGLYLALTIISGFIVVGYLFFQWFTAAPNVDQIDPFQTGDVSVHKRPDQVTTTMDANGNLIEVVIPGLPEDRKEEFYTFLVVGKSQETGGSLTDTMMLAAYDVPNQTLSVMSLPRDTYVKYNGRVCLINEVYNRAGGDKDGRGIAGLKSAVKDLTGVYPDYHIIVRWEAVGELVDAIGGVEYDVPFDMYYNDLSQHFKINLKKGRQVLNGEQAMGLVRWRHNSDDAGHISSTYGYAEGDIGRIKTQQSFLKEVIKKCLKMDVLLTNLTEYVSIFQKNVDTNLTASNLAYFVKSALGGLEMDHVNFVTLPWASAQNAHIIPVGSQIVQEINKGFNPYEVDISRGELKLVALEDVPRSQTATPTPDPDATEAPDATPDPDATSGPGDGGEDDPILPPGAISRPSPRPSQSAKPGETAKPGQSARPGQLTGPEGTPKPGQSHEPDATAKPAGTAKPTDEPRAEATAKPTAAPQGGSGEEPSTQPQPPAPVDDEPILPPM